MVDPRITQILDFPTLQIDVDRQRAARLGVAQRDVANNMLASLSGSSLISPTYYLNPQNGVNYTVAVVTNVDKLQAVSGYSEFPGKSGDQQHQSDHCRRPCRRRCPARRSRD